MAISKSCVAILYGGRSTEHQISLLSAQNVYKSIDKERYEVITIGIGKNGHWYYNPEGLSLAHADDPDNIELIIDATHRVILSQNMNEQVLIGTDGHEKKIDILFPILHGTYGEDGSIQGLAKLANLPCVGCGILGSAACMDKEIMKHVLRSQGIMVADWITVRKYDTIQPTYTEVAAKLGPVLFIKPVNLGSSVGITMAQNEKEFIKGLESAFLYDTKVLIEERINGRELECAVLGNHVPKTSLPGEVVAQDGFYSYENKYLNEKGASLHIPADLTKEEIDRIQTLASKTFIALECRGLARVDMFLTPDDKLVINEVNTIPGFTNISMYPKLWEITGLNQRELITELIEYALDEHRQQNELKL